MACSYRLQEMRSRSIVMLTLDTLNFFNAVQSAQRKFPKLSYMLMRYLVGSMLSCTVILAGVHLDHIPHPAHLLKAALSTFGDYRGLIDIPYINLPTCLLLHRTMPPTNRFLVSWTGWSMIPKVSLLSESESESESADWN